LLALAPLARLGRLAWRRLPSRNATTSSRVPLSPDAARRPRARGRPLAERSWLVAV